MGADKISSERIIELRVENEAAIRGMEEYKKAIIASTIEEKKLKKAKQEGKITDNEYAEQMAKTKSELINAKEGLKLLEREFKNNVAIEKNLIGSSTALRAELSKLTAQYDNLGRADREGAKGAGLKEKINGITEELKNAEGETGRFQRQVGSYEEAINKAVASNSGMAGSLMNMANSTGGVVGGLNAMTKAALKFIMNPIGATIAAIVVVFKALQVGISSSEENTAKFNQILAPMKVVLDVLLNVLQKVVGVFLDYYSALMNIYLKAGGFIAKIFGMGDAYEKLNAKIQEGIDLEKRKNQLAIESRKAAEENKKIELETSELRNKVAQKDKYTHEERLAFLDEAIEKETSVAERNKKIAEERLTIMEAEAARAGNTAEVEDKLSQSRIAVTQATIDLNNKTKELNAQRFEAINAMKAEEKAAADAARAKAKEAAERAKEAKDKEREAIRSAEDAAVALLKEGAEKQRKVVESSYSRQIEDLKRKLQTEQNLTTEAKNNINSQISLLEQKRQQDLAAITDEELLREADKQAKIIELKLSAIKKGSDQELALKLQQIELQKQAELKAAEKTGIEKALVEEKYRVQADGLRKQADEATRAKQAESVRLDFENKINEAKLNGENYLQIEKEQRAYELENLHQFDEESDAEFKARQLTAQQAFTDSKKAIVDQEIQIEQAKYEAASQITGALAGLLEQAGENSKAAAIASKMIALAEIAINTGKAIAAGTAQAQSVPFPGNLVAIATTIATVMSNVTTAIKTVKSVKLANGGLVTGSGTGTSDSVPAMLSNGESVMTARTTSLFAPILSAFNTMGGGVPIQASQSSSQIIGEEMLARAVAKGVQSMPAPVVAVSEIERVTGRVRVIENISQS